MCTGARLCVLIKEISTTAVLRMFSHKMLDEVSIEQQTHITRLQYNKWTLGSQVCRRMQEC